MAPIRRIEPFKPIPNAGRCAGNRVLRQLDNRVGASGPSQSPGPKALDPLNHRSISQEDDIDWKPHPAGVDGPAARKNHGRSLGQGAAAKQANCPREEILGYIYLLRQDRSSGHVDEPPHARAVTERSGGEHALIQPDSLPLELCQE